MQILVQKSFLQIAQYELAVKLTVTERRKIIENSNSSKWYVWYC